MIWDHRFTAFSFGFFGGLGINLFRLYALSQAQSSERPPFDTVYWCQLFGMAAMGGVAALAHDLVNTINPFVALNVGLSVPAILKAAAEVSVNKRKRKSN